MIFCDTHIEDDTENDVYKINVHSHQNICTWLKPIRFMSS